MILHRFPNIQSEVHPVAFTLQRFNIGKWSLLLFSWVVSKQRMWADVATRQQRHHVFLLRWKTCSITLNYTKRTWVTYTHGNQDGQTCAIKVVAVTRRVLRRFPIVNGCPFRRISNTKRAFTGGCSLRALQKITCTCYGSTCSRRGFMHSFERLLCDIIKSIEHGQGYGEALHLRAENLSI